MTDLPSKEAIEAFKKGRLMILDAMPDKFVMEYDILHGLKDAEAIDLAPLQARIEDLQEDYESQQKLVSILRQECECPDCKCATSEDADSKECGCNSIVCSREDVTLVAGFIRVTAERDRLKEDLQSWKKELDHVSSQYKLRLLEDEFIK